MRLYRRNIIENNHIRFYEKSRRCEDLGFSLACTLHSKNYYVLDESLYHNRPNTASKTRNYTKNMWQSIRELMLYLQEITSKCDAYNFSKSMDICIFYFVTMVIRNEMILNNRIMRKEKIQEVLSDNVCRNVLWKIDSMGMNKEYRGLYFFIKKGSAKGVISYMNRLYYKKNILYPFLSKIILLPGMRSIYKRIRLDGSNYKTQ